MSSFNEIRDQFIKRNPRTTYSPDCIALFTSQSRETQEVFVDGITVPYDITSGSLKDILKDSSAVYIEYLVPSTYESGLYPYYSGSKDDVRLVSGTYLTGESGSMRILEIPIENPQERDGYYFFETSKRVSIAALLSPFDEPSPTFLKVSFTGPENYYKSDNNPIRTANVSRKSIKALKLDRFLASPNKQYAGTTLPVNYPTVLKYIETSYIYNSGSLITGSYGTKTIPAADYYTSSIRSIEKIDKALLADIQDSNYSSKAWSNLRYNGVVETKRGVVGNEPALSFNEFEGAIYPTGSDATTIKAIQDADREIQTIYFVNYANGADLQGKNPSGSGANLADGPLPIETRIGTPTQKVIVSPTATLFTIMYKENGNNFEKIPSANIYGVDRGGVFVTGETGKVLREL